MRACILGIIPGDVTEAAIKQCEKTLMEGETKPIIDITREMAGIFKNEFGVPLDAIEKYIGCKSEAFSMRDLIRLKKVYRSLHDGMAKREDFFDISLPVEKSDVVDPFEGKDKEKSAEKKEAKTKDVNEAGSK